MTNQIRRKELQEQIEKEVKMDEFVKWCDERGDDKVKELGSVAVRFMATVLANFEDVFKRLKKLEGKKSKKKKK